MKKFTTVDEYIGDFPPDVRKKLEAIRQTIKKAAPKATEKISYGIPAYMLNGRVVYFGGFRDHVSLFPASSGAIEAFKKDLRAYKTLKGTIQFPLDRPLPLPLIRRIVEYRIRENQERKK